MNIIYEPKGKAREYSPLAANFYNGCDHGCIYCYGPRIRYIGQEEWKNVTPRKDIVKELEKNAEKMKHSRNQVLFNFMGDPYCKANDEYRITRKALEIFLENRIPVAILTKGGTRLLQDIDIIKKFEDHIMVGATITTMDEELSKEWEPGAASPQDRVEMLEKVKDQGIKTWASFEPVIDTRHAIDAIEKTLHCVDVYKVGKMNNFRTAEKNPDWQAFLDSVVAILRKAEKPLYIKHDLRIAGQKTKLYGNEVLPDEFCAQPW